MAARCKGLRHIGLDPGSCSGVERLPGKSALLRIEYSQHYSQHLSQLLSGGNRMQAIVSVKNLTKTYASGHQALKAVDLDIRPGEIFALLGPNGAGKTTLINVICGIVKPTHGAI